MDTLCRIELLGGLRVRLAGRLITRFRTQKTGALLAYLAYYGRQAHTRDALGELFWPALEPGAARNNLSTALSSLRRMLEPPGALAGGTLLADRLHVRLNPAAFSTDVAAFEQALQAAKRAETDAARKPLLETAIAVYGGPLLAGYENEFWIGAEQERLHRLFLAAQAQLARIDPVTAPGSSFGGGKKRACAVLPGPPPLGTVSFLRTEWEDAAAFQQTVPQAFSMISAGRQALLQAEFRRLGGYEVEATATMSLVAFAGVRDALECALACRQGLAEQAWPAPAGRPKERMALDVGDVEWEEDTYRGDVLLRVAQLLAGAQAGQILGTEALVRLLRLDQDAVAQFTDLGMYRLSAGASSERLFQVDLRDRETGSFPPPKLAAAYTGSLPPALTRFFGREEEIDRLVGLLTAKGMRLLTLTGVGGVGKTRLALEVARALLPALWGSFWFLPLEAEPEALFLPTTLLRHLGLTPTAKGEHLEQAVAFLNHLDAPVLLVVDNFEHLAEEGAALIQALLERAPRLTCLVTSRHLLGIDGEHEWIVAPLPPPCGAETPEALLQFPAAQLFLDRAQAARPDFQITDANASAVARLCKELEGLPLALELASAQALTMTPTEMLASLGARFDFLAARPARRRLMPARHRTLRSAILWSYELLPAHLQRFFVRLSVFRGGWTTTAAAAIGETSSVRDDLADLRARSFLQADTASDGVTTRFRMLETLRAFADEALSPTERIDVKNRSLRYFLALVREAQVEKQDRRTGQWLEELEAELDNLRAALEWGQEKEADAEASLQLASESWMFFRIRGYFREGQRYLTAILAREALQTPSRPRADALNGVGALAQMQGDYEAARTSYEASLAVWQVLDHKKGMAAMGNNLGLIAELQGDYARARALHEQSLQVRRELGDQPGIAASLHNLGVLMQMQGDLSQAKTLYEQSLALKRKLENGPGVASSLNNLGNIAHAQGDFAASKAYHEESLALRRQMQDRQGIAASYNNLGTVAEAEGALDTACALYKQSLALKRELGDQPGIAETLKNLANVALARGQTELAQKYLSEVCP